MNTWLILCIVSRNNDNQKSGIIFVNRNTKFILILAQENKQTDKIMNTLKSTLSIIVALSSLNVASAQTLKDAIKLTDNEQYENAAKVYQARIQAEPTNGINYFYLGENYFKNDEFTQAKALYQKGIDLNPANSLNYVGLGKIYWHEKNAVEAKANFYKALTISKSKDATVLMKIAEPYINAETKNLPEAFTLLNQALALEPKNPEIYILLGDAYLEQGDGSKAIMNYEKATDLDKTSVKAILRTGQLYGRAKNYSLALDYYKKAEKIDSTFAPAYREKAELYGRSGQFERAVEQYKKYLALNNNLSARTRYASFLYLSKKYSDAITEIKEVQKQDTNNAIMYRLLGYSYYETSDYSNGIISIEKFFEKAAKQGTKIISSDYSYKGKLLAKTGQDSLGVITLVTALDLETDSAKKADLNSDIGTIYFKAKKPAEAITFFEKNIALSGGKATPTDYNRLGLAYYQNKEYGKADSAFAKITHIMPDLPLGYLWRAISNSLLDPDSEKGLAKPFFETYITKIKPEEIEKNKKDLTKANEYLGAYYFAKKDYAQSKIYWLKVKELDASNTKAKVALEDKNMQ